MQYLLNAPGLSLAVDAAFGSLTAVAVRVFQSIQGLKVDRIIGNATWPVLIVKVSSGSSGDAGAPCYSAQARIHACVIFFSGRVVSLAINRRLQVADAVAWSSAFVGQRKFNDRHDLDEGPGFFDGLPWNDNLPCREGQVKSPFYPSCPKAVCELDKASSRPPWARYREVLELHPAAVFPKPSR